MILSRRGLFTGGAALLTAPAIVRVASIMPVSARILSGGDVVQANAYTAFERTLPWVNLSQADMDLILRHLGVSLDARQMLMGWGALEVRPARHDAWGDPKGRERGARDALEQARS